MILLFSFAGELSIARGETRGVECPVDQQSLIRVFGNKAAGVEKDLFAFKARNFSKGYKRFDVDRYLAERMRLSGMRELPERPKDLESMLAWQETLREKTQPAFFAGKPRPTIDDLLEFGISKEGRPREAATVKKLIDWSRKYSKSSMSEKEVARASVELELLLHQSSLTWEDLALHGREDLTKRWVSSQIQANFVAKGWNSILGNGVRVPRAEALKAWLKHPSIPERSAKEWVKLGWKNTKNAVWNEGTKTALFNSWNGFHAIKGAGSPIDLLFIYLPDHQFIKVKPEELMNIFEGGLDANFNKLVEKYHGKLPRQILYNGINRTLQGGAQAIFYPTFVGVIGYVIYHYVNAKIEQNKADKKMVDDTHKEIQEHGQPGPPPATFHSQAEEAADTTHKSPPPTK